MARTAGRRARLGDRRHRTGESGNGGSDRPERRRRYGDLHGLLFTGAVSLLAPWFGREAIVWVVDMAAVGTACGYLYTCIAARSLARRRRQRLEAALGLVLSAGFLVLLCVPGMPGFMAPASWIALAGWIVLGALFYFGRVREYAAIPGPELDRLILGGSGSSPR